MAVTLFTYKKGNTIIHRLPALLKLIFLTAFCIFVFWNKKDSEKYFLYTKYTAALFISLIIFLLSKPSLVILKDLKPVFFIGLFVTAFMAVDFINLSFSKEGLIEGLLYTFRFLLTSTAASVVFKSTSSVEIKEALESVQNIFAKVFPPVKKLNLALLIAMTINFIPMVFDTWNKINLAARARSPEKKSTYKIRVLYAEFSALFSCLLYKAETTRKAMLNRS